MIEQPTPVTQAETLPAGAPRHAYTAPRLTVYGTAQGLTHGVGDINGISGTPDGG